MKKIIIRGEVETIRFATGHKPHRSGAGIHQHKGTKRNRTRAANKSRAIKEQM